MPRYKKSDDEIEQYPDYLAIYEFESQEAFKESQTDPEIPVLFKEDWARNAEVRGAEIKWAVAYESINTWEK